MAGIKTLKSLFRNEKLETQDKVLICLVYHGLKPAAEFSLAANHIEDIISDLSDLGIKSFIVPDIPPMIYSVVFSKEKDLLNRYAEHRFDHIELGKIFGYPTEDINGFSGSIQDGIKNKEFNAKIIELYENGNKKHWIPFIFHIPSSADIIDIDKNNATKKLAMRYCNFVQKIYPKLCDIFIKEFYDSLEIRHAVLCRTQVVKCSH